MPLAYREKLALRHPQQGPAFSSPKPAPALALAPNDLFQQFMRTCIKKVQDQALAALAAPTAKIRDNTNKLLKPRNFDLCYGHLHIEC